MAKFKVGDRVYYEFTANTNYQRFKNFTSDIKGIYGLVSSYRAPMGDRDPNVRVTFDGTSTGYGTFESNLRLAETRCDGTGEITNHPIYLDGKFYSPEFLESLV